MEILEVKKERVAVFPATSLKQFETLPGYTDEAVDFEQFRILLDTCVSFRDRDDVEGNEEWKQIIPYTYIYDPDNGCVLGYRRADKGGDPRLAGKWSLGFGGHINPVDDRQGRSRMIALATHRELQEELTFRAPYDSPVTQGFLYLDTTPVDRVHFGVIRRAMYYSVESGEIRHNPEIEELRWIPTGELAHYPFEGWSQVLGNQLLVKLVH